jgi:hypothetical protein
MVNETKTCLVILTSPYSFNHWSLYGLSCLEVFRFNFLTKVELAILLQPPLSVELGLLTRVFFVFFCWIIFNFIFQYRVDWEIGFIICFGLRSMSLSWSHESGPEFNWLIQVVFCVYFLISSFNWFGNYISWFVSICFLWGYFVLMTQVW